jgi:AAHS family 4-hydroxybenzoate transporter-like MFS transporter
METPTSKSVDLVQLINQREIGRFHLQLLGLCAAVVFMDGFDAQAIGYVAPSLSQAWHLAPGALGPVFGAGLFGIMLGALVGGPVADYLGRKGLSSSRHFSSASALLSRLWSRMCSSS